MLNVRLAIARGLSKSQVNDLTALHVAMDMMVQHINFFFRDETIPKDERKAIRRNVRRLEYQMQDIWGFERNKARHTHWKRFNCLREHPPKWYEKMAPPVYMPDPRLPPETEKY